MSDEARFSIRYGFWRPLLSVLGMGPGVSRLEVDGGDVVVRMGWAFRTRIPLASIADVRRDTDKWGGIGVHGWRGSWLVNGSVHDIVTIEIDPATRARVMGFPVRLRRLLVSLDDPDAAVATLSTLTAH